MIASYSGAVRHIVEALGEAQPATPEQAREAADEALHEYIDNALIYTTDVLLLWDGTTHEEVDLSDYDSIMSALIASTYFQLRGDWADTVDDGVREYAGR